MSNEIEGRELTEAIHRKFQQTLEDAKAIVDKSRFRFTPYAANAVIAVVRELLPEQYEFSVERTFDGTIQFVLTGYSPSFEEVIEENQHVH